MRVVGREAAVEPLAVEQSVRADHARVADVDHVAVDTFSAIAEGEAGGEAEQQRAVGQERPQRRRLRPLERDPEHPRRAGRASSGYAAGDRDAELARRRRTRTRRRRRAAPRGRGGASAAGGARTARRTRGTARSRPTASSPSRPNSPGSPRAIRQPTCGPVQTCGRRPVRSSTITRAISSLRSSGVGRGDVDRDLPAPRRQQVRAHVRWPVLRALLAHARLRLRERQDLRGRAAVAGRGELARRARARATTDGGSCACRPRRIRAARARARRARPRGRASAHSAKWSRIIGTMSRSVHCSRASTPSGPVPHHSSEPSESLAWSAPCEPPPTWCEPPQSRNS